MSGRKSKAKGSSFERTVRDTLRKIYPAELRQKIQRVPLSGAGVFKGDVVDLNNTDWCYEAKKHETLALQDWWRQAKRETANWQHTCMVFSSNYRPVYWVIRADLARDLMRQTFGDAADNMWTPVEGTTRKLYERLAQLQSYEYYLTELDNDEVIIMSTDMYIGMRKNLYEIEQVKTYEKTAAQL